MGKTKVDESIAQLLLDNKNIEVALQKVEPGLKKYLRIMEMINKVNVTESKDFQKEFNGFYRMRQRPKVYYEKFYTFMENNKYSQPTFEETLMYLYKELKRIEASFSSKLVATINPNLPIWDTVVLNNLGLKAPLYYRKNRIKEIIEVYQKIIEWYDEILKEEAGKRVVQLFEEAYPNARITDVKKVDFVLWQIR